MMQRKDGQIINISSIGVLANATRFSAYVASKAALDALAVVYLLKCILIKLQLLRFICL
jgi:NAD(P)-dependent dehydrogenase (short-subunit alcohol dehydrogenase family)